MTRALTVREGQDGVEAKIQPRQALQGGQLKLGVLSGGGPATAHHTAGVHPAVTRRTAAPLGLRADTSQAQRSASTQIPVTHSVGGPNGLESLLLRFKPRPQ